MSNCRITPVLLMVLVFLFVLNGCGRGMELQELTQRQARVFAVFAIAEGAALAVVIALIYVAKVVDQMTGLLLMFAVVLAFGAVLFVKIRGFLRERNEITGRPRPGTD